MQKNNFCIFSRKTLKISESINAPSHFLIYKNNESKNNQINQKLKQRFFSNYNPTKNYLSEQQIIKNNYILSQKLLLTKYNRNYNIMRINNIIFRKKCHLLSIYNDTYMFINEEVEYIKKYYTYNESIKIIPKRQVYFKHLMIYIEGPIYKDFIYNKILKLKGLEKLNIYKRTNYPKKFNKKEKLNTDNNILLDSNIIFNTNVIETIENCSTSLTQCSNKKISNINKITNNNKIIQSENNEKKNVNVSMISEIKYKGCHNKRSDSNISCIDNSLLILMKDLAISPNIINTYLYKHNNNYKQLYNKMKSKSKTITYNNRKEKEKENEKQINILQNKKEEIIKENSSESHKGFKENGSNLIKKLKIKSKKENRDSTSLIKKINNIKIIQLNSNSIKSSLKMEKNENINSCNNNKKYGLSMIKRIHLNLNLRKDNKKLSCKVTNPILFNYFNKDNQDKTKENNHSNIFDKNKNKFNFNNKIILKGIKKIISNQRSKNNSLRKYINPQKLWTNPTYNLIVTNSLNESETKKMIHTINPVRSISISNNQFFKCIKEFGNDVNNDK